MVQPYSNTYTVIARKNSCFISSERTDNQSNAVHALPIHVLIFFQLRRYCYWGIWISLLISEGCLLIRRWHHLIYPSLQRDLCLLLFVPGHAAKILLEQEYLWEMLGHLFSFYGISFVSCLFLVWEYFLFFFFSSYNLWKDMRYLVLISRQPSW